MNQFTKEELSILLVVLFETDTLSVDKIKLDNLTKKIREMCINYE